MSHRINPTTATTINIPTHMPALKIPPTTSHELRVIAIARAQSHNKEYCFMSLLFPIGMQKLCRCFTQRRQVRRDAKEQGNRQFKLLPIPNLNSSLFCCSVRQCSLRLCALASLREISGNKTVPGGENLMVIPCKTFLF